MRLLMKAAGVVVALALCLGTQASASSAAFSGAGPRIDAKTRDCLQIPPEETPELSAAVSPKLPAEVRVMTSRKDLAGAKAAFATVRSIYGRIGVALKGRFDVISPPKSWSSPDTLVDQPTILKFMKRTYGGRRPSGVDLVYYFTPYWAGGFADCIGGVRFANRAFAFGSSDYATEGVVPAPTADEGVIMAHELGHLLGAQHHYFNCVEALPSGAPRGDVNPCTVMAPYAGMASTTFGTLEKSFIRMYASEYAKG
jgi:hypothetical protein